MTIDTSGSRKDTLLHTLACLGGVARLAAHLGVSPSAVSQWVHGRRPLPARHCPAIERLTGGQIRCEDLRPDVDWAYLRGTQPGKQEGRRD